MNENIKELIKYEYENGSSMSKLSKKYNINISSIKKWSSQEKWIKKKEKEVTKKESNHNQKSNQDKVVTNTKEIQIKQDILEGKSKDEIMENYGIGKSTYYNNANSIRQLRLKKTQDYLKEVIEEVYQGKLKNILKHGEKAKLNLFIGSIEETKNEKIDFKKIQDNEKAYNSITKMLTGIMQNGDLVTSYEMGLIEQQLKTEYINEEYLEIEKEKNKLDIIDNKIEIELKGI